MAIDPNNLPKDPQILQQLVVDLTRQLDKTQRLLQQLLTSRSGTQSEQLSPDQLRLFAQQIGMDLPSAEAQDTEQPKDPDNEPPEAGSGDATGKTRGRRPRPSHLKRERIIHDLAEQEKHCAECNKDLRHIGEEVSERYEYVPAQMLVIEDVCHKYACDCTVKTATKPAQPIEKSSAGARLLAHVIVSKVANHLPVHRQAKMMARFGVEIPDQTMCGWMRQSADLLSPLYDRLKNFVFASKVVGTYDTPVKVLDRELPHTRKGRMWPYVGDREHPPWSSITHRLGSAPGRRNFWKIIEAICRPMLTLPTTVSSLTQAGAWWKWVAWRVPGGISIRPARQTRHAWARCWLTLPNSMRWRSGRGRAAFTAMTCDCCVSKVRGPFSSSAYLPVTDQPTTAAQK